MGDEFAFPVSSIDGFTHHGMTLRDYFAGQAIVGLLANTNLVGSIAMQELAAASNGIGVMAYYVADAMLAARTPTQAVAATEGEE